MSKTVSIYLNDETIELVQGCLLEKESFSTGISRLIKLGATKQMKMSDLPMGKVIDLLKVVYDKKYKALDTTD